MKPTCPGPTLGVVGGGQLGRMLAEAASPLGVDVVVLDPTPDCPAARVAEQVAGAFDDPDAVRALAERVDALTLEIELADPDVLEAVSDEYDVPVQPSPDALRTIQDKLVQNRTFADAGVPVPEFVRVDDADDLAAAVERFDGPGAMLKARTGGYDGRGNLPVAAGDDYETALQEVGAEDGGALAEELVDFEREVAVIGVRGDDEVRAFPLTETIHEEEILRETAVPARTDDAIAERAREVALDALEVLDGRGVFGIELFEVSEAGTASETSSGGTPRDRDGEILLNEVAPRPHNSGHWTIEGATASQFEQHVRAVLGWPLALAEMRAPTVTTNILGDVSDPQPARLRGVERVLAESSAHLGGGQSAASGTHLDGGQSAVSGTHLDDGQGAASGVHLHWYGKHEVRPLRKMGHVTLTGENADVDDLLAEARDLRGTLTFQ